jgi:hypothetical protein
MKTIRLTALFALLYTSALFAQSSHFTKAVPANEFTAAGLSKLTPEELLRLDLLVERYSKGALQAAEQEAVNANERAAEAEKKAALAKVEAQSQIAKAQEEIKKTSETLLNRAKNLLAPGSPIEYKTTESRIVGSISGWEPNSIFELENGQIWAVADGSEYVYGGSVKGPKVILKPARFLGGFQLEIIGMGTFRVRLVGNTKE